MSEMVERVAKASYEAAYQRCDWETITVRNKLSFRQQARAAIAAMREPTEGMLTAGIRKLDEDYASPTLAPTWQAMIDAALEEP